nr:MAG: replication associated protein [Cressdnaviricota sp.]
MQRSRGWCFTINNYTDLDVDQVLDLTCEYLVFGFEVGKKTETPHIQGYVFFENALTRKSVSKKLRRASLRKPRGTPEQNRKYCIEDGDYYEFGEMPHQGKAQWDRIESAMLDPMSDPAIYNQYKKMYKDVTKKSLDHERRLLLVNQARLYTFLKLNKYESVINTIDTDPDCYDSEEVLVMPCYGSFRVESWYNGFPQKVRRGYEVIVVDPEIVIITYSDHKEYAYLLKKYIDIIECPVSEKEALIDARSAEYIDEESDDHPDE